MVDGGYIEGGMYHYYMTDHLGNNRVVVNASGTVTQRNHYYPFGTAFAENTVDEQKKQPYKYNGKELDQIHGLNLYDYSARYYESAVGRFTTVDPHAENYYSWSPYMYCANNPILNIDPTGEDYWSTTDPKEIARFLDAAKAAKGSTNVISSFNYESWSHARDEQVLEAVEGGLTYNDETRMLHGSYLTKEANPASSTGYEYISNALSVPAMSTGKGSVGPMPQLQAASGRMEPMYVEFYVLMPARLGWKASWGAVKYIFNTVTRPPGTTNTFDANKSGFASGNKEKMGKPKRNMPGNNQVQNKQVRDLVKKHNLTKDEQCKLHDMISGEGLGYHEIESIIVNYIK